MQQLPLGLDPRTPPSFASFHAGPNAALVATLMAAARNAEESCWIGLSGPPSSGKSHLLVAAMAEAQEQGRRALYVGGGSLRESGDPEVLAAYGNAQLLCLDRIDALLGAAEWEEALFHLLNRLREGHAGLIAAAAAPLRSLGVRLPDLKSRLVWATDLRLAPLADEDKLALLRARASACGLSLDQETAGYLLQRLPRDPGTLIRALDALAEATLARGRRPTRRFVAELLQEQNKQAAD